MSERSSFGGLRDFSVDAQRRVFVEQQEIERQAAEHRRSTRKAKQVLAGAGGGGAVAVSGVMSAIDQGGGGRRQTHVGDDDDDSIADDDASLDSQESFYVGIARADYTQPDSLHMYGEEKEEERDAAQTEDRLGIARASVAMTRREDAAAAANDWDADIPIYDASTGSSLYAFMNGASGNSAGARRARAANDRLVALPVVGAGLAWKEGSPLGEEGEGAAAVEQVYEHAAAEGKAFIDKIVHAPADALERADPPAPAAARGLATPGTAPGGGGRGAGHFPALSPLALFSPGLAPGPAGVVEGEDNCLRQMREREIRKEATADAVKKMDYFRTVVLATKDTTGKVDASEMMMMLEKLMKE